MYLKDLLNDKQEEKDVGVLLDKGMFNLLSHITQTALFSTNPWTVLEDINRKKNMKKDKFVTTIFLTSKDIKKHSCVKYAPHRYVVELLTRATDEATKSLETHNIYFNRVILHPAYHRVDIYFGVRGDDDELWKREERLGKVNTPYYKVRFVYPDNYELYDAWSNVIWGEDAEYSDEYAIYYNDKFKYSIALREKIIEEISLIDAISLNSERKEIPDTYEESCEDYGDEDE